MFDGERAKTGYRVEVSGWDVAANFFIEKCVLEWSPDGSKAVLLGSAVRPGIIVFVRLVQDHNPSRGFPLPYQIGSVGLPNTSGLKRVTLMQLQPQGQDRGSEEEKKEREAGWG